MASAWVRAASRLDGFETRSALRTWLAGFVVNVHREIVRSGGRTVPLDEGLEDVNDTEDTVLSRVDLDRALARLPDGFRRVLVLHDVEGFTHEEIGEMLDVVPGTSKSQLSRARRRVRALLTEQNDGSL